MPDNREKVKLRVAMNQFIGFYYNQLYIALFLHQALFSCHTLLEETIYRYISYSNKFINDYLLFGTVKYRHMFLACLAHFIFDQKGYFHVQ